MQEYLRWATLDVALPQPSLVLPDKWSSVASLAGDPEALNAISGGSLVESSCVETSNVWYHGPQVVEYSCPDHLHIEGRAFYYEVTIDSVITQDIQR